jgi:hypothetical protein
MDIVNPNKVVENNNRDNMMNDNEKYMIEIYEKKILSQMHMYIVKMVASHFLLMVIC